ncbi:MAG: hypothetical protein U0984_04835, partial [Prosthecobacter sp.]|nr:hypothetical protein [Prosthecobacter sp.]
MRGFLVALLSCSLLLSACNRADYAEEPVLRTFLERYFSTWSAQDMEGYGACFDPAARITFVDQSGHGSSQGLTDFLHG